MGSGDNVHFMNRYIKYVKSIYNQCDRSSSNLFFETLILHIKKFLLNNPMQTLSWVYLFLEAFLFRSNKPTVSTHWAALTGCFCSVYSH